MNNKNVNVTVDRKEDATKDFLEMVRNSWTYHKFTDEEIQRFEQLMDYTTDENSWMRVKGSYKSRWTQFNAIYQAFLTGLGYDGGSWRD